MLLNNKMMDNNEVLDTSNVYSLMLVHWMHHFNLWNDTG